LIKSKIKKIFLWGYYGSGNIGDNILLDIIVKQIKSILPNVKITINCRDKQMISNLPINVISFSPSSKNKFLYFISLLKFYVKILQSNDIIIFGGGTQIYDNSKYQWKSIFVTASVLFINKLIYRKKVIHYGVGIGSINTKLGKFFTKLIIKYSDFFIVRDKQSYEKLLELNAQKQKLLKSRDLAYSLLKTLNFDIFNYKKNINDNNKANIGFSLFEYYKYTEIDNDKNRKLTSTLIEVLKKLDETKKYNIYLFAFQKKYGNKDEEFLKSIINNIGSKNITLVPYQNDYKYTIDKLKSMDVCIGMRYHFLVLSLMLKKPTLALSYANKVKSEFEMYNLDEYLIDLDEISVDRIIFLLKKIQEDTKIRKQIEAQVSHICADLDHSYAKFKELLQ